MRHTRILLTAAAVAVSLGATACSVITAPAARTGTPSATSADARGAAAAALHRLPKPGSGATSTQLAPPVVGVNLYVDQNYSTAQIEYFGARDLKYIARTLKLKAVSIAFDYNVPNRYSDTVTASAARTPTIADLAALTSIARSYGLQVEYRVLFAVDNSDSRAGSIQPKNLSAWLRSLLTAQTPALKLAQRARQRVHRRHGDGVDRPVAAVERVLHPGRAPLPRHPVLRELGRPGRGRVLLAAAATAADQVLRRVRLPPGQLAADGLGRAAHSGVGGVPAAGASAAPAPDRH
jgi:hypothetical protein